MIIWVILRQYFNSLQVRVKVCLLIVDSQPFSYFNSLQVRVKVIADLIHNVLIHYFNSLQVRVKDRVQSGNPEGGHAFQFLTGAGKRGGG